MRIVFLFLTILSISFAITFEHNIHDFEKINPDETKLVKGNIKIFGNTVLCTKNRRNQCVDTSGRRTNAEMYMSYIDIDNDSNTFNSSQATLRLSNNAQILWAAIYWQGYMHNYGRGYPEQSFVNELSQPIILRDPNGIEHTIYANYVNYLDWWNWYGTRIGYTYAAFTDITDIIKNGGTGNYIVGNIPCREGRTYDFYDGLGNYGAWTIVVIYKDDSETLKNLSVYRGYTRVYNWNTVTINVSGFYTPEYEPINANLFVFAGEGDKGLTGDYFKLNNQELFEQTSNGNHLNEEDNFFNSSISESIDRYPRLNNNNGIDIHSIEVGKDNNTSHPRVIGVNEHESTITLGTNADAYFPSMVAFSVQMYIPKICFLETFYDKNNEEINESSIVRVGDPITSKITLRNDDNHDAQSVRIIKIFDVNLTEYIPNSTSVKDVDFNQIVHIDDNSSHNGVSVIFDAREENNTIVESNLTIGPLGEGEPPIFEPYTINPNHQAEIDYKFTVLKNAEISMLYNTKYRFEIAGENFTIDTILPKCREFNNTIIAYNPDTDTITFANKNFNANSIIFDANSSQNALYTQIPNRAFSIKALSLQNALNNTSQYVQLKNSQKVAILDAVNAGIGNSCRTHPYVNILKKPHYIVDFNNHKQQSLDINASKAIRSARFRARFFHWVDLMADASVHCNNPDAMSNTLKGIPQCIADDPEGKLRKIFGQSIDICFSNAAGNPCSANTNSNNGYGCIECLVANAPSDKVIYSCSIDSFAIRPATYTLDVNESLLIGKRSYRLDINASDIHDNLIADYNTTFTASNSDTNITSTLLDRPGCTNPATKKTDNLQVSPVVFSGSIAIDNNYTFNDVGKIELNITDNDWTRVDQAKRDHSGNIVYDCIPYSWTNTPDSLGRIGCMAHASKTLEFHPKEYSHTITVKNADTNDKFTYLSDDPRMHATMNISITALLDDNTPAQNYVKSCYAKDINTTITLNNNKNLGWSNLSNRIQFFEDQNYYTIRGTSTGVLQSPNIIIDINESNFTTGSVATIPLQFNIKRKVNIADIPFVVAKNDFNISTEENTTVVHGFDFNRVNDKNVTFVYARLRTGDIEENIIQGNDGNITTYYEIYNPLQATATGTSLAANFPLFAGMSQDPQDPNWIINNLHTNQNLGTIQKMKYKGGDIFHSRVGNIAIINNSLNNGSHTLQARYYRASFPFIVTTDVNVSSWLVYNKYDPNAATVPLHFKFINPGNWKGTGKAIIQGNESNQSKINRYRINW
ncbi:hypothetical protein [Nitratiruptor sp. YY09-18]|uniref:hypothetical protein n=1 Tax=Nitratiruptor sp. YY09-18 TaxID=2724901 RepID=UPI001915178E|nr:hypothetical protein [Nitratiruptor sp. YY09-18]BCD67662.1 hypothetical protein NitYY0918_C0562 [Nitratiruptor sp. YY09-18]